jgi:hypothetical protein
MNSEFMHLTDAYTQEEIFIDPSQIALVQQLVAQEDLPRRTRIELILNSQVLVVAEEAKYIALASGRGYLSPTEKLYGPPCL